jgi:hypothetical protein
VALLVGVLALSVGSPVLLVALPLALTALLLPETGIRGALVGGGLLAFGLLGGGMGGLPDVDRGWGILLGGGFVAATLAWPARPFIDRGLAALAFAAGGTGLVLVAGEGWAVLDALVADRIAAGTEATVELGRSWMGEGGEAGFAAAAARTGEVQRYLFPAQAGAASLLGLGVAWWLHGRVFLGRSDAIGAVRSFRFPDPVIWVLIVGLVLVLAAGWDSGLGRAGANLAAFAGVLFALRGAGVFLELSRGIGWFGVLLVGVGLVLATPVMFAGATMLGLGDAWFDLRARAAGKGDSPPG